MSIYAIGINHKTASVALREKIYFSSDQLSLYLQDLLQQGLAEEAVLLSTCNRSELYCESRGLNSVIDWFVRQANVHAENFINALYIHQDEKAIAHLMAVASGLDSMILGEPQILGQMKEAFSESCAANAIGASFHRLFAHVFHVAKAIRTTTSIGACPVSVASAAFHFAKQCVPSFSDAKISMIGAGDTAELMVRYLKTELSSPITLVNRSLSRAKDLAQTLGGKVQTLDNLMFAIASSDIVFSATGSIAPIVNKALVQDAMHMRQNKPLFFIDMAVPRDIDPAVSEIENVFLYCIDDLKTSIEANRLGREHAAIKAKELIEKESQICMDELLSLHHVSNTIRAYRGQIEEICQTELLKAKHQLRQGADPDEALEYFAAAFTKKLLHTPSVRLRQAGVEGQFELLKFAKQLFAIPDKDVECL